VITVSIYEYDEEGHLEIVKEEGRQLGIAEGKQLGLNEGKQLGLTEGLKKGINAFIKLCKDMHLSDDDIVNKLIEDYQLSKDEAVKAVKNYY
jgi:flagellar biosynthesis/type III secretory pathway protein FliH